AAPRTGTGDEPLHLRDRGWRLTRPVAGRRPDRDPQLALDLLRQPPHRRRHLLPRPRPDRGERGPRARGQDRLARFGPDHGVVDRPDLRADQDPRMGLDGWPDTGGGRLLRAAFRRLRRSRVADPEPDHAAARARPPQPGHREPGPRLPGHRRILDLFPGLPLLPARPGPEPDPDRPRVPGDEPGARDDVRGPRRPAGRALRAEADTGRRHRGTRARAAALLAG